MDLPNAPVNNQLNQAVELTGPVPSWGIGGEPVSLTAFLLEEIMDYIKRHKWIILGFCLMDIVLYKLGIFDNGTLCSIRDLSLSSIINIAVHVAVFMITAKISDKLDK